MTYSTVSAIQKDAGIRERVSACISIEGVSNSPEQWAADYAWRLAAQPGWAEAWEASLETHTESEYEPGRDEDVITDSMILSAVQNLTASESPEGT